MTNPEPTQPIEIVRRDLRFDVASSDACTWHPDGRHVAHWFSALSLLFPEGESFFIDSVRHYADRIRNPKLKDDVKGFLGQEAMHTREHQRYNLALEKAGLPARALDEETRVLLDFIRRRASAERALAITIALEHFTAIMADGALRDPRVLEGAEERFAALWRWHAIEETEHKAVAFDVYRTAVGDGRRDYWRRVLVMLGATVIFWAVVTVNTVRLARADKCACDVRGWGRLFRFLWLTPGVMWPIWRLWLGYFRPDFHPWQHDNREHVATWKAALA